jgi:hypothetical protein
LDPAPDFIVIQISLTTCIDLAIYRRPDLPRRCVMTAKWGAAAIVCVMAFVTGSECVAQSVPVAADEEVFVRLVDSKREVRGRLVHLDASTLSIWGRNGRVDFPLTQVARVDKKERDISSLPAASIAVTLRF